MRRVPVLALLVCLAVPASLAGCLGQDGAAGEAPAAVAQSAEEAGARAGAAPVAASDPYQLTLEEGSSGEPASRTLTAYPVPLETNPARDPLSLVFEGEFGPESCNVVGGLPLGGLGHAPSFQSFDFSDSLAAGDVYSYSIEMRFTNTEQSWGELHLFYGLDATQDGWTDPTGDKRGEVVMNFTGQSYRADDEADAWVGAACWYGAVTTPIPYTVTVSFTFAQNAIPSGSPFRLTVPDNATRLLATGVPLDASKGVLSHFRVFDPQDELLCECALSSAEQASSVALPGPGEYVVLVDHTDNGFVALAFDAPPAKPLEPLRAQTTVYPLVASEGGSVDETVAVDLPSTPLGMGAWVFPPGFSEGASAPDGGSGMGYSVSVVNGRGEVLRLKLAGYATFRLTAPGISVNEWMPIPIPGEWDFMTDHHAYGKGGHQVQVKASQMRGETALFALHYVR